MRTAGFKAIKKKLKDIENRANQRVRTVYFTTIENIIMDAALDTGLFMNNFFVTVDRPTMETRDKPNKLGDDSIANLMTNLPDYILGKKIYVSNSLPYSAWLEYGSRAHTGKIRAEIQRARAKLRRSS